MSSNASRAFTNQFSAGSVVWRAVCPAGSGWFWDGGSGWEFIGLKPEISDVGKNGEKRDFVELVGFWCDSWGLAWRRAGFSEAVGVLTWG